ncbi:MAG: adenylate/guanylate cyclase domain-containing protein, partial [Bacteroidota bacterium]
VQNNQLWILLSNGAIYTLQPNGRPQLHLRAPLAAAGQAASLQVELDGDLWVGGLGELWSYDHWRQTWTNYDPPIRQRLKNTSTYRKITQDRSNAIWAATNFGAIKITQAERLFDQYLSGGSEYCSNVFCSMRGITGDEKGNIYFTYYNSIHVLDAVTGSSRPLFPNNDFFNQPFGITYHDGHLYTGNGIRIRLSDLYQETLFPHNSKDIGAAAVDAGGQVWLGYENRLYRYREEDRLLLLYTDSLGSWENHGGTISYVYPSPRTGDIWVGTLDDGITRLAQGQQRTQHWNTADSSLIRLPHPQVNGIIETSTADLWIGSGDGLVYVDLTQDTARVLTTEDGLPNNFINGLLSEGDSCLWISTDNGLCRWRIATGEAQNFYATDGLSANEFNRISCYQTPDGQLFFGGLNGVNSIRPDERLWEQQVQATSSPLVCTSLSYLDGDADTIRTRDMHYVALDQPIRLTHRDRMFSISYALLDYRRPETHRFQYYLEGYEPDWGEETTDHVLRYTDLDPGEYNLHLRARSDQEDWNEAQELSIPVYIQPAIYQRVWFWPLCVLLGAVGIGILMQYRVYLLKNRREELEKEVAQRTSELAEEKRKSEALLLNILPAGLADELKENGHAKAKRHEQVTVMFSDFQGFTRISELLEPEELVAEIDLCFRAFDEITERHGLEKIKTIGDAYLLVGGIADSSSEQAKKVVLAALEIQEFMNAISVERRLHGQHFFEARIGIHTGPIVAGIVGIRKFAYDIWGNTVNIASRMESNGQVGRVNLSATTYDLVSRDFDCTPSGTYTAHNTQIEMYLVEDFLG